MKWKIMQEQDEGVGAYTVSTISDYVDVPGGRIYRSRMIYNMDPRMVSVHTLFVKARKEVK